MGGTLPAGRTAQAQPQSPYPIKVTCAIHREKRETLVPLVKYLVKADVNLVHLHRSSHLLPVQDQFTHTSPALSAAWPPQLIAHLQHSPNQTPPAAAAVAAVATAWKHHHTAGRSNTAELLPHQRPAKHRTQVFPMPFSASCVPQR